MTFVNLVRKTIGTLSTVFPQNVLLKVSSKKILLPFYHAVSDVYLPHISNLYTVRNTSLFEKDLDFFCKNYLPISTDELYAITSENRALNKPVFHLSFDDGLKQVYHEIAPILERKGIPASIFLNSQFIDNKALFFRYKASLIIEYVKSNDVGSKIVLLEAILGKRIAKKKEFISLVLSLKYYDADKINQMALALNIDFEEFLKDYQPYLNSYEIASLIKRGFTIGSHSIDHPYFKLIDIKEQKRQVIEAAKFIESNFDLTNRYFSFPFSDDGISKQLFQWLFNEERFKLSFGVSGLKQDVYSSHLHRIPIEASSDSAEKIVKTEYLYFLLKQIVNKNKIWRND